MNGIARRQSRGLRQGSKRWPEIKNTLIQTFGDHRGKNSLTQDLANLKQKSNESAFYENCRHTLSTIWNYVELHSTINEEKTSKITFFTNQKLGNFVARLRELLGPIIKAMRPNNLEQAVQFIKEEENIRYSKKIKSSKYFLK